MSTNKISAVIFDFDGTLIDSFTPRKIALAKVSEYIYDFLNQKGIEINLNKLLERVLKLEKEMNEKKIYDRNLWWKKVLGDVNVKIEAVPDSLIKKATYIYWNTIKENSKVYHGVLQMLQQLRKLNLSLGLISDTDGLHNMKLERIKASGIIDFFDVIIVAGEDTKQIKPSTEPFLKMCRILKVKPTECLFIGDNPDVDVSGPRKLGMKVIIISDEISKNFKEFKDSSVFYIGRNYEELASFIFKVAEVQH